MTREEIDRLWSKALQQAVKDGEEYTRYHFADLLIRYHFADLLLAVETDRVISVLETLIDYYGGRDMSTYGSPEWKLDAIENQNPEIQEAMKLVKELKDNDG